MAKPYLGEAQENASAFPLGPCVDVGSVCRKYLLHFANFPLPMFTA